ncbi:hypothetical protein PQI64_12790 [Shewanella bicestrii]
MKKLLLLAALLSAPLMASETDWVKTDDPRVFTSLDIVSGKLTAMIKTYSNGVRFGLFLPYEKCYVAESYSEPFTRLIVVGGYHNFKMQCLGKNKAVVFADDESVNEQIIDSLINDGNVCLTIEDGSESVKMCFSGKGVKEIKASAGKQ